MEVLEVNNMLVYLSRVVPFPVQFFLFDIHIET